MAEDKAGKSGRNIELVYELMLCLNLGLATSSVIDLSIPGWMTWFYQLEFWVKQTLHIPQTDFITGHVAFPFSAVILGACLWILIKLSARIGFTLNRFRPVTILVLLFTPVIFWVFFYCRRGWPFAWPYRMAPLELTVVCVCATLYLMRKWRAPNWITCLLVALHFAYWFFIPGGSYFPANYTGPLAPTLGFLSVISWGMWVNRNTLSGGNSRSTT